MDKKETGDMPKKAKDMRENPRDAKVGTPGWTSGLRQIYDSVVEEPLPDAFKDLLSKLDRAN